VTNAYSSLYAIPDFRVLQPVCIVVDSADFHCIVQQKTRCAGDMVVVRVRQDQVFDSTDPNELKVLADCVSPCRIDHRAYVTGASDRAVAVSDIEDMQFKRLVHAPS